MSLYRCFIFFLLTSASLCFAQDPDIYYLTWKDDPSTTMMVMWHTTDSNGLTRVEYKTQKAKKWKEATGSKKRLFDTNINIHRVEITTLKPDTEYLFRIDGNEIHSFRTLTDNLAKRPLHVVIGGDAYFGKGLRYEAMNKEIASKNPDFAILAGDISYAEGLRTALRTRYWKIERWEEFFRIWTRTMRTSEGRIIPIVPVIGNHDVKEGFDNPHKKSVIFYEVFAFPRSGFPFRTMQIGKEITFYLLDSGHTYPVAGLQTEWLAKAFKESQSSRFHIPVYHIPAYPSVTSYTHRAARDIRKFWVPLFEENGVKVSMEHDCHTYKRTYPIRQGVIDEEKGIYYLGDGAWGVPPEKPQKHWYLYKAAQTNCYWDLHVTPDKTLINAYDSEGIRLDSLEILSR